MTLKAVVISSTSPVQFYSNNELSLQDLKLTVKPLQWSKVRYTVTKNAMKHWEETSRVQCSAVMDLYWWHLPLPS